MLGLAAAGLPLNELISGKAEEKKLGIALVGLGRYSTFQLAPALQETEHCRLAAIVTGTPEKAEKWSQDYNIPSQNIYRMRGR